MNSQKQTETRMAPATQDEVVLRPPTDIFEDTDGVTLLADMPGVANDRLNVQVEANTLTIEGEARIELAEGVEALHADVRSTRYSRSFMLSNELEADKITAALKDGVLRVELPKAAERRRRVQVAVH